jgi:sterol desaturase/sphingolipid hydroxylase (fatty acid hydroxylase superfamily)
MLGPIVIEIAAFALFGALSFVFADRDQPLIRRDFLVDALYFLVSVLIYSQAIGQLFAHVHPPALLTAPSRAVSRWPLWAQAIVVLFAYDAMQYALHRWLHSEALWRFHAVHHTAREIDILTSFRIHPVDMAVYVGGPTVILLLAGFSPAAFAVLAPLNFLMSCLTHANLNWTYGPFRYVLSSPMFHRWHHAIVEGSLSRNYAPNFPIWDLMFGTFYMPAGEKPVAYGAPDVPDEFIKQLAYPFQKLSA